MRRRLKGITNKLLSSIDVMNTLNGGVIEPRLNRYKMPDHQVIEMIAPGISMNRMKAEINNNLLTIYYVLEFDSLGKSVTVPRIVYSKPIPYYIDAKRITASVDDQKLTVQLPFNELANGYHRDILANGQ